MATLAEIVQRVYDNLYSTHPGERPFVHLINGAVADGSTTSITVDDGTLFAAGDTIEFVDTGEQCYVLSVATNTLTVIRGWNGTTGAAHSDNTPIRKNPRITYKQVTDTINEVVQDMTQHGLFVMNVTNITLVAGQNTYPLTGLGTGLMMMPGVVSVYYQDDNGDPQALPFHWTSEMLVTANWSTSDLFGEPQLTLLSWGQQAAGEDVYVMYTTKLGDPTELESEHEDLLVVGSTARLIGKLIAPMLMDPGAHTNRTVQPGQAGRDARWFTAEYLTGVRRAVAVQRNNLKQVPGYRQYWRMRKWRR